MSIFKRQIIIVLGFAAVTFGSSPAYSVSIEKLRNYLYDQMKLVGSEASDKVYMAEAQTMSTLLDKVEYEGQQVLFRNVVDELVRIERSGYLEYQRRNDLTSVNARSEIAEYRVLLVKNFEKALRYCKSKFHGEVWARFISQHPDQYLGSPDGKPTFDKIWNVLARSVDPEQGKINNVAFEATAIVLDDYYRGNTDPSILGHIIYGAQYIQSEAQLSFFKSIRSWDDDSDLYSNLYQNAENYIGLYGLIPKIGNSNITLVSNVIEKNRLRWIRNGSNYYKSSLTDRKQVVEQRLQFLEIMLGRALELHKSIYNLLPTSQVGLKMKALDRLLEFFPYFHRNFDNGFSKQVDDALLYLEIMNEVVAAVTSKAELNYLGYAFSLGVRKVESDGYEVDRVEIREVHKRLTALLQPDIELEAPMKVALSGIFGERPVTSARLKRLLRRYTNRPSTRIYEFNPLTYDQLFCQKSFTADR